MFNSKLSRSFQQAGAALAAALALAGGAHAETYSATNIQVFHTWDAKADAFNGTGTADKNMTAVRFEHFGVWEYGDNYIDLDLFDGKDVGGATSGSFGANTGDQLYFVYQPRISLTKLGGGKLGGFVKDVYVTYRREQASYADFKSDNLGLSVDLAVPGTVFFEQDFMLRKSNLETGHKWLSRTVWLAPFNVGGVGLHLDGLVLLKATQSFGKNLFSQIDLMGDLTEKGRIQAGIRLETARYKLGGDTYNRNSPYLIAKFNL